MEAKYAVGMILLVIAAIFLLVFSGMIVAFIKGYAAGGLDGALLSVAAYKVEYSCLNIAESPISPELGRRHVVVGTNQATVSTNGETEPIKIRTDDGIKKTYAEPTSQIIDQVMADELYKCWKLFGQGRFPIFLEGERGFVDMVSGGDRTGCFICSEITFNNVPASVGAAANVRAYLATTEQPTAGTTYLNYLNNKQMICEEEYKNGGCWNNIEKHLTEKRFSKIDSVDTSKTYAVVALREGYEWCGSEKKPSKMPVNNFAYIISEDEIGNACDIFVS